MRLIEAIIPAHIADDVIHAIERAEPTHWRYASSEDSSQRVIRAFFAEETAQGLVDDIQSICARVEGWRIIVFPVEATAPAVDEDKRKEAARRKKIALREEIYADVAKGAALSADFYLLTVASTVVATLGLNTDNIPAVIGAMVIAPLLGPILAFSFASALGDFSLLTRAARNALAGLATGVAVAALIGLVLPPNFESHELMSRTVVGLDSIVLALAAGAAAALSIVAGAPAALVGVMVAVALLPPAASIGLFFGAGELALAARAALLLSVNVVCIMLSAQAVYFYKDVRPRTWLEQKKAGRATRVNFIILTVMLVALAAIIALTSFDALPLASPGAKP